MRARAGAVRGARGLGTRRRLRDFRRLRGRGRPIDASRLGSARAGAAGIVRVRNVRGGELGRLLRRVPVPLARDAGGVLGVRERDAVATDARRARRDRTRGRVCFRVRKRRDVSNVSKARRVRRLVARRDFKTKSFRRAPGGDSRVAPRRAGDGDAARLASAHDGAGPNLSRLLVFRSEACFGNCGAGFVVRGGGGEESPPRFPRRTFANVRRNAFGRGIRSPGRSAPPTRRLRPAFAPGGRARRLGRARGGALGASRGGPPGDGRGEDGRRGSRRARRGGRRLSRLRGVEDPKPPTGGRAAFVEYSY